MTGNRRPKKRQHSSNSRKIIATFLRLLLAVIVLVIGLITSLRYFNPGIWMLKIERQLFPPINYPASVEHIWIARSAIAPVMQLAVIAAEDQHFPSHWGLDMDAIMMSVQSRSSGHRLRGASTISQQTAKNLFLWPGRSWLRKGLEAGIAIGLELILNKPRILELYLNIVEFGPGIFGVEAASRHYFSKSARMLTRIEAATLAAVLPNPYRYHVTNPSAYLKRHIVWIIRQLTQLQKMGPIFQ